MSVLSLIRIHSLSLPVLPGHLVLLFRRAKISNSFANMADAMCGPSNPLQQFTKQSNHDRTLQQDRLTSRHSPAQGFRSADPNAGHLDPEFEAFQAGLSPSDLPLHHPVPFQQPAFAGVSQGPLWANDFQRLEISPQPHMQHQRALRPNQVPSSWAQGFQQNIAQEAPRAQSSSPSPLVFQQRARYGLSGFQSNFTQPSYAPAEQSIKGKEPVYEEFDQAAFDLAFDQAQNDIVTETEQQDTSMDDIMKAMDESKHADLGAGVRGDIMHDNEPRTIQEAVQQPIDQHPDDDALAATAHELLEKVEHNRSDKFKNSQFLGLMRKLRDREVKVEGDKMVSTVSLTALASSPADSTYGSGTASPAPLAAETSQVHILSSASAITPRPDSGINVVDADHEWDHWESPYR